MDDSSSSLSDQSSSSSWRRCLFNDYWDLSWGLIFAALSVFWHFYGNIILSSISAAVGISFISLTVSKVAEVLAHRLKEPYGTYVITISSVTVEILLLFIILLKSTGTDSFTIQETVKGTIIAAVLVDINVLLGLSVFLGGLSFKEQAHNEDSSRSYTIILFVTGVILLIPSILQLNDRPEEVILQASTLIAILLAIFYLAILIFQTRTHIHFFQPTFRSRILAIKKKQNREEESDYFFEKVSTPINLLVIFSLIALVGIMAEVMAQDGLELLNQMSIPPLVGGLLIAIVAVAPELFTAIKAAKNDEMQRVVNIAMGACTISILITVPILFALAKISGIDFILDFSLLEIGVFLASVILSMRTTEDGETNYLQGLAHIILFIAYLIIIGLF